jgi:GDSL-like Lipase/Acylhydrolase family
MDVWTAQHPADRPGLRACGLAATRPARASSPGGHRPGSPARPAGQGPRSRPATAGGAPPRPGRPSSCRGDDLVNPLLLPIAAVQGRWMRSTIKLASPATGPTSGTVGDPSRPPVRIAVVGESTAARLRSRHPRPWFPGWLARELAARTRRPVRWEVVGQFGATARRIRYRLLPRLGENLHVAVLLAGANDVLTRRTPGQWGDDLAAIVEDLGDRAEQVAVTGMPPFAAFPSLPTTLGRYLDAPRAPSMRSPNRSVPSTRGQPGSA